MTISPQYHDLNKQLDQLRETPLPPFTRLGNILALLKETFGFFWVGLYLRRDAHTLELGPYQGGLPCFTIDMGKGVCGLAAQAQQTQIVNDVSQFPGYIACHPEPQAEIVVPGVKQGYTHFVLDIDALEKNAFSDDDRHGLEAVVSHYFMPEVLALQSAFPEWYRFKQAV